MNGATVFLIAFFTSVATSVGTFYLSERLDIFGVADTQETVQVPKLEGLSQADAMANLKSSGLVLIIGGREASPTAAEGTVLRQSVPVGQAVTKGQVISITLAIALPKVPAVIGKSLSEAAELLKAAGYELRSEELWHDTIPVGVVVSQNPDAETGLSTDESVTVKVSKGPGKIEVPKLIGFHFNKAKKALEEVGLNAKIRWVNLAETSSSIVLSQTPKHGKEVSKDTDVEIVINRE